MHFRLLGPLEVTEADRAVRLGGGKQRSLLALLLLHGNQVVSAESLIDALWQNDRPQTADNTLQTYISRLRKALGPDRIVTQAPGYMIRLDPGELDVSRFEQLAEQGRIALEAGEPETASKLLREALDLWRGPALVEFMFEAFAQGDVTRLEEARLVAIEDRIDSELFVGRQVDVVAELESMTAMHPLRERLRSQLMLALYRTGRQADALETYQKGRTLLVEELGINPGPYLQQLQTRILLQDPTLDGPPPAMRGSRRGSAHMLVPTTPHPVRKAVTVLAAEVSPRAGLDAEVRARVLSNARETVATVLERYGAQLSPPSGDGIVAVFGVPALHEDDAARAVRGASRAHEVIRHRNPTSRSEEGAGISLRVGIGTGEVLVTGTELVDGDALTDACRLRNVADVGETLISDATQSAATAVVAERVAAAGGWRVLAPGPVGAFVERRFDTPLVGRDAELRQLLHAFERAAAKRICHLFTLLGPAGIGKSRLAHELGAAVGLGATTLMGRCLPYGEGITFWPLSEIVKRAAGDTTPDALLPLLAEEERGATIAQRVASALGVSDAEGEGDETFWAFRKLFEALARRNPLLLVIEDIHWAESTLLDFVEYLADSSRGAPIMILCLARPELLENRRSWGGGKYNATSVLLDGLSRRDADTLIAWLSERLRLADLDQGRVAEVADGNPLFIEQILALAGDDNAGPELTIPPTIQSLLAARLDRLPIPERVVLERASIVGREFMVAALEDLSPEEERADLGRLLEELVKKELIRPDETPGNGERAFRFRHILIRDTTYESVPKETRSQLHEQYANWVERFAGERADELDEVVGHHLERAHGYRLELYGSDSETNALAARAASRLTAAGERAFTRSDVATAKNLLSRATALSPSDPRGETLALLASSSHDQGDRQAAKAYMSEAMTVARESGDVELQVRLKILQLQHRLHSEPDFTVEDLVRSAAKLATFSASHGYPRNEAAAHMTVAWAHFLRGELSKGQRLLERVSTDARSRGDARLHETALRLLCAVWAYGPFSVRVGMRLVAKTMNDGEVSLRTKAAAIRSLALMSAMVERFEIARGLVSQGQEIMIELGLELTLAGSREVEGVIELLAGDAVRAEAAVRSGINATARFKDQVYSAGLVAVLVQALYAQERYEEASEWIRATRTSAVRDVAATIRLRGTEAMLLARAGRSTEARSTAQDAVTLARRTELSDVVGEVLMNSSETAKLLGDDGLAHHFGSEAIRAFAAKGNLALERAARLALGQSEAATS